MRKLRLEIEELAVESFQTTDARDGSGTVFGREEYTYITCPTDPECNTYGASCAVSRCYTCRSCPVSAGCTEP
jgi:hypothetical protein